jgi:sterol desaturase/sphingolipid hydroxylase (fatty acid hydroxylase superfamily)
LILHISALQYLVLSQQVLFPILGLVLWTLFEYVLHRYIFHYKPKTEWGKKLHFMSHGIHHDYPRDSTRLVMPLLLSLPLATILFIPTFLFLGFIGNSLFAGFLLGYMCYDGIHYAAHHMHLKSKLGRFIQQYHLKHHFLDDDNYYGVSSPIWDIVFSTYPHKKNKELHDTFDT